MFDWDDQELANIIWDEAGENEDHIVPYPHGTHNKPSNVKLTTVSFTDSQECSNNTHGRLSTDQFVFSPSNATRLDLEHTGEKAQVYNRSQNFDNQLVDEDRNNYVEYSWANVGSFDDLDKILSNNDMVYGNTNISNAGALWSSSKDIINFPEKSEPLSPSFRLGDLKTADVIKNKNPLKQKSASDKMAVSKHAQMGEQRKSLRFQKPTIEKCNEFEGQYSDQNIKTKSRNQQRESCSYNKLINPLAAFNTIIANPHSVGPTLPQEHQQALLRLSMTPQEKIEKLRRRQQMRALVAIRKQQQQFKNHELCNNNLNFPKTSHESLSDSDATPLMMEQKSTLEDTILHQLENVIATLGIQIRVCIRDSLFRLAQSSLQRQHGGDTVSTNTSGISELNSVTKSSARTADGETKTNPIDRAVAHLLFHTPYELSREIPQSVDSPSSVKPPYETPTTSTNFPVGYFHKTYKDNQLTGLLGRQNQLENPCTDALANASNKETTDGSEVETEASSRGPALL